MHSLNHFKLIAVANRDRCRIPLAHSIDSKHRSFVKRTRVKCACGMRFVMPGEDNASFESAAPGPGLFLTAAA